jgi:hypothetical protein
MNLLKELGIVSDLHRGIDGKVNPMLTTIFTTEYLEKFYISAIVVPHVFFQNIAQNSVIFDKFFLPFDPQVIADNAENLRLYYLYSSAENLGLGNFSKYINVLLGNMDLSVVANSNMRFDPKFSLRDIADLQLIDSFMRGAEISISSQEY